GADSPGGRARSGRCRRRSRIARSHGCSSSVPGFEGPIACLVGRCELFDGVAEHRARHHRCMPVEESGERRTVLVADAAEQPTHRLVAQVLLVLEQQLCDGKRLVELTPTDETEGCEDGSAALPQAFGPGKLEEDGAWPVEEPGADD